MAILYEHWRSDYNECFYVGISKNDNGARARQMSNHRSKRHQDVVNSVLKKGGSISVVIREKGLLYEVAKTREKMLISYWRALVGRRLVNATEGGDGTLGFRLCGKDHPMYGKNHREESRRRISLKSKGFSNPMFGRTKEKAPCFGRTGNKHPMFGKNGEDNPNSKLTYENALEILNSPCSQRGLAKKFGVSRWAIVAIKNGISWKHLPRELK